MATNSMAVSRPRLLYGPCVRASPLRMDYTGWAKKTAHSFRCNNFVCSQPIFGTYTVENLQLEDIQYS